MTSTRTVAMASGHRAQTTYRSDPKHVTRALSAHVWPNSRRSRAQRGRSRRVTGADPGAALSGASPGPQARRGARSRPRDGSGDQSPLRVAVVLGRDEHQGLADDVDVQGQGDGGLDLTVQRSELPVICGAALGGRKLRAMQGRRVSRAPDPSVNDRRTPPDQLAVYPSPARWPDQALACGLMVATTISSCSSRS
jgi:hypothetical protein